MDASPLLEREHELEVIEQGLDRAAGGRGGLVLIEGPAGIGKSALVACAREAALERNVAVAVARASELERADAFGVVRQLFEPRLRAMSGAERGRALAGAAALAAPAVLPETAADVADGSSFATLHGLYWLVAGLASERPQLLLVDDLHWADEASVRFLRFLANRLEESPVLLLAAQRPDPAAAGSALRSAAAVTVVTPAALSPAATAAALGDGADPAFTAACHAATGGNPLLVRRLAGGLRERGVPFTEAGAAEVGRTGPDAVADAVATATARLGADPVALARALAILGDGAVLPVAAELAGLSAESASAAADALARAGLLEDGRPLRYQHALVRDAVLGALTAGEREESHRAAARILVRRGAPGRASAAHLLHTEPGGDREVVETLLAEGHRALAAGAPSEARALLARALAEPPPPEALHGLLLALARAERHLGAPEAVAHVEAAYDAAGSATERGLAALSIMWAADPDRRLVERGLQLVEPAIDELDDGQRELRLQLRAARLMLLFMSEHRLREAVAEPERYADLGGETLGECLLLVQTAIARFVTARSADDVVEPLERAAANAGVLVAAGADAPWVTFLIGGLFKADRLDGATEITEAAIAQARRSGSAAGFAVASAWLAWIALRRGDGESAEASARAAYEGSPGGTWQHQYAVACVAEVLAERAQLDEATAIVDREAPEGSLDRSQDMLISSTRSILRAARGDAAGALAAQLSVRPPEGAGPAMDVDFDGWLRIARARLQTGDTAEARREAAAALGWARTFGTPGVIGQALTVSGVVEGGTAGLGQLREAVALLERSPARRELARALVELGGALRRDGQRVAARDTLRRALDIAAAGGLTATADRARDELRLTGARIRRDHATGVGSLTPSERRIAERAAAGATNPEIAQALFVTNKTVEMHLSRVYRKLDIGSRDQLPAALAG